MIEYVILLYGLWMCGFVLVMLYWWMMEVGFCVYWFDYFSVVNIQECILEWLCGWMVELVEVGSVVYLVGYSFGGLLVLQVCYDVVDLFFGWVVCLGLLLFGSVVVWEFFGLGCSGEVLFGYNCDLFEKGFECWDGLCQVGVIVGCLLIGLGVVLVYIEGEYDGIVVVFEMWLFGLVDYCVVDVSYMGLLFFVDVVWFMVCFLCEGCFVVVVLDELFVIG